MNQPEETLLDPASLEQASALTQRLLGEMDKVLLGRHHLHRQVVIAVLSRGHLLLEGMPGLGKTAMVKALGTILDLDFKRVQFTPDLMPGDILGAHILQGTADGGRDMVFRPGPVFANILLADEINRASPKTQSALLEAMQERCVTLLGQTRPLPAPFFVLASQNPVDLEGTYPLPEAQLDRFLFKLQVDNLAVDTLTQIIATRHHGEPPAATASLEKGELEGLFATVDRIFIPRPVCAYISRLVAATHPGSADAPAGIGEYVTFGASPRAAIAIAEAARACALLRRSPAVGFEDVREVAPPALNHRLILNYKARIDGRSGRQLVDELLQAMDETNLKLADGISVASHA